MSDYQKMTTPEGIARYPYLSTPDKKFSDEGVFQTILRIELDKCEDLLAKLNQIQQNNVEALTATNGKAPKVGPNPIPYKMEEEDGVQYVDFKFKMKPSYKTKTGEVVHQRPAVVDSQNRPMTELVGYGSKIKVAFVAAPYLVPAGAGVALRLVAVQVLDLVHPRESQEDTFEKVEGGFSTEEPASAEPPQSAESSPQPSDASQF
tara:strand:+ start:413 stop:1027 length:615 start_codon:yes stop_codon:yes gene_type:complete